MKANGVYKRSASNSSLIKRFLPYYRKYGKTVALDLFCAALTTVCDVVLPLIVRKITDTAMNELPALTVRLIAETGIIYVILRLVDAAANYYMANIGHVMGARIETDMRTDLFAHLQALPFSYYDQTKIGQIMSRITSDLFEVTEFAHHCPEEFFIASVKIIASFVILVRINLWLTLIMFAMLPLMFVCTKSFRYKMRKAFIDQRHDIGEINAQVEDSLLGVRVVRSFANENIEKEKFAAGNTRFFHTKKRTYKYMAGFHTVTRVFDGLMYIAVVILGALFIRKESISVADYTAYLLYVSTLLNSVRRIVEFAEQFEKGMTGIERFTQIMDAPVNIADKPDSVEIQKFEGSIKLDNITFGYNEEKGTVLKNLCIDIKAGENVALVGPSGGGKTTICSLIPRFYEVDKGDIYIDSKNIRDITLHSLRSNIGVVQQDVYLFSGTVRDNIIYGKPGATDEEMENAARLAGAHEFIMKLPDGYDTYIGERGVMLSGGQKQRISIARVFLKNPPILILDEATSALDNDNELVVQKSLSVLAKGRTTLTVAHRLTTIRNADRIIVLTEDGIAEEGTHAALMEKKGMYHKLYNLYTDIK
ncbi:MAG: ABC transporter ATP-binding protein/permease [Clostridia bacterium]|nr:ABC transporter ATP-binding protein/permease [Clostridia bacterium]